MKRAMAVLLVLLPLGAYADSWQSARSVNRGNYVETYVVSVNTTTQVQIINPTLAQQSASIDIRPNSASTMFIGTNTATLVTTGFPIASSTTFSLGGQYTGSLYAMEPAGASTGTVRIIYWLKTDALR